MEKPLKPVADETQKNIINILSKKTKLVLSSGGIKGIAHVGAIKFLEEYACMTNIDTFVGVSIGSIIAALVCIGYTATEMYDIIMSFDFSKMLSTKTENIECDGGINTVMNAIDCIFANFGIDDGCKMTITISQLFKTKGYQNNISFKDLYDKTKKKLIIVAACVNTKTPEYFSVDTSPNMSIIKAIRMSSSIPIYFTPIIHNDKLYIDGGCMDGYPMHLFCDNIDQAIGVHLSEENNETVIIKDIGSYLINMVKTFTASLSDTTMKGYEKCSIIVRTKKIGLANMAITYEDKKYLYDLGYNAAINKFNN